MVGLWGEDASRSRISWEHFLGWTFRLVRKAWQERGDSLCHSKKTEKGKCLEPFQEIQTSSKGSKAAAMGFG